MKRAQLSVESLKVVARAERFRHPSENDLGLGAVVKLNSGGPNMMVVDLEGDDVTVAWRDWGAARETTLPSVCVHRVHLV
ncbi:hypothetical protein [Minwuia sp.]|uniref:hypothetical protein n=1 Tax=Minwuia sp. TaxID=2493630 RepID=UPI003A8D8BC4